jgi:PAS domain S-box-containing protein/putative nucleotidyltransferase with HDIG domain
MSVPVLLAVDDRPDNLFVLEQLAAAYLSDIKIITAGSADQGLALASAVAVDGALIDVQMPGMNGIEMCRRLKADPRTAPIHVILVTAHQASPELKAQGLAAGADDFITKPIDSVELAAKVRVMLRLRAAEHALRRERDSLEQTVQERTKALRDAELRYRTLFHAASDAIFITDLEGGLLEVNEEACRLLGYSREEILGLTVGDLAVPEYGGRRPEIVEQILRAGHVVFELDYRHRDGSRIPVECNSRMLEFQGRSALLSIARDIRERKQAEAALQQSEEKYRLLVDNAKEAILVAQDGYLKFFNPAAVAVLGQSGEALAATPFSEFIHPEDREMVMDNHAKRLRGEAIPHIYAFRTLEQDGQVRWVEINAVLIDWQGRPATLNFLTDITRRRQAEMDILRQNALVQGINQVLLETLRCDTDEAVAHLCLRVAQELTGSAFGWIGLLNAAGRLDTIANSESGWAVCSITESSRGALISNMHIRGIWGAVIKQQTSLLANDPSSHPDRVGVPAGHPPLTAFLGVPLKQDDETIGMISLANKPAGYESHDQVAIETLSVALVEAMRRKRGEEELRASEERYRSMISNNISAVALHEMLYDEAGRPCDYRFLAVNPAFETITGLSAERVVGQTVMQILPDIDSFWLETYGRVATTGEPVTFERYEQVLQRYFRVSAYKTQDHRFATIFTDITEAKQAEERRLAAVTDSLLSLATAIEMRDPYISGHQIRVTDLACAIGQEMGLPQEAIDGIRLGGILHDIGKIAVPTEILSKPGKLSEYEFAIIKNHPTTGYEILKNIDGPWPLAQIVLQHHERLDGSGYPQGLKEEEIILEARILAVADVVEAMASHRPYRPALGIGAALEEIARNKGILYDPQVADVCTKLFTEKHFRLHDDQ